MAVCACLVVTNHSVSKGSRLGVPLNISLYHSTGKRSTGAFPNLPHSHGELGHIRIGVIPTLVSHFGNTSPVNPKTSISSRVQVTAYEDFSVVALPI